MRSLIIAGTLAILVLYCPSLAIGQEVRLIHTAVGLKNFPFDIKRGEPRTPPGLEGRPVSPGKPGFMVVKFKDKINAADRERLSRDGVRFYGYVPVDSFLAKVPYGLRDAVAKDPAVEFVADYRPAYRLDHEPLDWVTSKKHGEKKLVLQAFDGEDLAPIKAAIESMGGSCEVMSDGPGLNGKFIRVKLDAGKIADLASLDGVLWIEEDKPPRLYNDVSCSVIKADSAWGRTVPLKGTGQIVAVCDTGLDTGNTGTLHEDFRGNTSDGNPKLKTTFAYGRVNDWSDTKGHGTHTCGTAVGFGTKSNSLVPGTYIRGMAYDAQLVMQSVLNSSGGLSIPDFVSVLFPDAYNTGARVHSDSWGYSYTGGAYFYASAAADTYAWNNKDFLIVFSAGNDGVDTNSDGVVDLGSVASPSTAKDVICVGASENNRPSIATTYNTAIPGYYQNPIKTDRMADNPGGMAAFSGRGPCQDGRIKPDIVAPGTYVLSDKSSAASGLWVNPSKYGYSSALDPYYRFDSGTSMSAPAVAGSAAIVREFLAGKGISTPSSALVKGLLINGACDMTPGQYAAPKQDVTARPDMNQGWGRVDLDETLYPAAPRTLLLDDHASGLATGGQTSYSFTVLDSAVPVRVSLVWTDYPGTSSVLPNLVNDLDLVVTAPGGSVYHGNQYSGSVSTAGAGAFDRLNNVEGVTIPAASMTTGTLSVQVQAYNVPHGPQPYALVVSGGLFNAPPPVVTGISPGTGVNNAATPVTVTGEGFADGAKVLVGGAECQVGNITETSIEATVPPGIAAGTKDVTVQNPYMQSGTLAGGFVVTQDNTIPAAPQGLVASPGNAGINLRWTPNTEPDLAGYRVYFGGYSTTAGLVNTKRLGPLTNGQSYDINMKALDAAGNISTPSVTVSATPLMPNSDLPHYNWDGSPAFGCGNCHVTGDTFLKDFDYNTDYALCLSCHNSASIAHNRPVAGNGSHKTLVAAGSGATRLPTYGTVTSGVYSDTMYNHLKNGSLVVCTTCHNVMGKPGDVGRAWEYTSSGDGKTYKMFRGGWWDQPHMMPSVYYDTSLWTPTYSKDREALRVSDGGYGFNEYSGTVTFTGPTTVSPSGYVYVTLDDPYLRVPGTDNAVCLDCHTEATHQSQSCLACHGAHGVTNMGGIKSKVRKTGGTYRDVVFKRLTGVDSFAGEPSRTGICEVCHTNTLYYRCDGTGSLTHQDGQSYARKDCSTCHPHSKGFHNK